MPDYAAIAAKYGGTPVPAPSAGSNVDYASIAAKYGGKSTGGGTPSPAGPLATTSPFNPNTPGNQAAPVVNGQAQSPQPGIFRRTLATVNNFIQGLPGAATQTVLGTPARFAASVAEVPKTLATGQAANKTYNIPGLAPFQSIQSQESQRIQGGMSPLKAGALAGVNAIGSAADTAGLADLAGEGASAVADKVAASKASAATQTAIDAVTPELSGKKLAGAYKDIVTGNREVKPGGFLQPQDIGPSTDSVNLGTRLSDVLTSKDPVTNLQALGKNLNDTENQLTPLLQNDKTPVVKQGLTDTLDTLKTSMPREFQAIKDSKSTFENVIDFGKQLVNQAEPNINGIRNARIRFDTQAKMEYPSAFKDGGFIDMKTPAGRAIKLARDTMNDYAYNTAENGSKIKQLIGREADIFKATDNIAPKAAKLDSETKLSQVVNSIKSHPVAATASAYGVDKLIKKTTGLGF